MPEILHGSLLQNTAFPSPEVSFPAWLLLASWEECHRHWGHNCLFTHYLGIPKASIPQQPSSCTPIGVKRWLFDFDFSIFSSWLAFRSRRGRKCLGGGDLVHRGTDSLQSTARWASSPSVPWGATEWHCLSNQGEWSSCKCPLYCL